MLTLNDGRSELWQWDTGRKLTVDADCTQVHFSNKFFGRSVDVDVFDGTAEIPDVLLQVDKDLLVWAFVGTAENGYTKISKVFKVNKRNKPADYVFTPPEQTTLGELIERLDKIEESQDPDAIKNAVDDYLANNPIKIDETDPTVPTWAKQLTKPKYTAKEVGAVATVNGITPDENGNVEIEVSGGNADQGGGMSATASALLITILRNAVYSTDQSANITALENALASGGGEEPDIPDVPDEPDVPVVNTYTITAELVNVTSSNFATSVNENASYTATLTAYDGYNLDSVVVLMGGVDVTADVYADGVISIPSVTGNVEIIASAVVIEDPSAELVTDGLLAYFDFRTATYNNSGSGGSTTIAATQGEGQLFAWAKNGVKVQDERGINFANGRQHMYSQAGNTTETNIGTSMTFVMLTYGQVMEQGFNLSNIDPRWEFGPRYNNTNGGTAYAENRAGVNMDNIADYNFCVYRVDGNILTEIMDSSVTTYNGGDIGGFASWITTAGVSMKEAAADGRYCTAAAIYNRALSDVEIEEMRAFLNTLEVA
jgi:hypothetical protein